jgi:hypothetical protein
MEVQDILNLIDIKPIFYNRIRDICIKNTFNRIFLINVIIGVRGRKNFFIPCIEHLKEAIKNIPVTITIVEQDVISNYKEICKELNIDYIFVENSSIPSGDNYNRSFCFNTGFLFSNKSSWYLFHDIDMLVDNTFFEIIKLYIDRNPLWLQPYTKKRVIRLNKDTTDQICAKKNCLSNLNSDKDYKAANIGSTGGSILVRRDAFVDVGGFDPELFYGYGPEDSFFWSKLEVLEKKVEYMDCHFAGGGMFADDPPIEIYHMYHDSMQDSNPHLNFMCEIREAFWRCSYPDKLLILNKKRDILKSFL